jgi:hypothetical protein
MDGGNTTVWLFVASAVLQRLVTFEFRLNPAGILVERGLLAHKGSDVVFIRTGTPPS